MRTEAYRQWLIDSGKRPDYIIRFINQATVNTKATCLGWAIQVKKQCSSDRTLLDLPVEELYALWSQRADLHDGLPNNLCTYLRSCLQFAAEQEAPITAQPVPLNLSMLAKELSCVCPCKDEDLRLVLMRVLLLDDTFRNYPDKSFSAKRDLYPGGAEYIIHRAVIKANLSKRRGDVRDRLIRVIHPLLAAANASANHHGTILLADLRAGYAQLAECLEQKLENGLTKKLTEIPGWSGSAEQDLLLRMKGWQPDYSTTFRKDDTELDWYTQLGESELEDHLAETFLSLLELSLRHGEEPFSPPCPMTGLSDTDWLYYALIAPFDRLLSVRLVKEADIATAQMVRLLRLGLFRVDRMPYQGTSCLRLAPAALQTLSQGPTLSPDAPSMLEGVWRDSQLVGILLKLLRHLDGAPNAAQIFEKGPELIALLAAAPPESGQTEEDEYSPVPVGTVAALLDGIKGLPVLSQSTQQELRDALAVLQHNEQVAAAVNQLTALILTCHWEVICRGPSPDSAESLQRLIGLYRMRPSAVTRALADLWELQDDIPGDWACRSKRSGGESLLLAELYGRSAVDCLALAETECRSAALRLAWANRARSDARTAGQMALRLGEGLRAFDAQLLQTGALAQLTLLSAGEGADAGSLFSDFISPCAQALLSCRELLVQTLPAQGRALSAEARPAFDRHCQIRRDRLEQAVSDLRRQLFSPAVSGILSQNTGLWQAIPHDCACEEDWRALAKDWLRTPAHDAAAPGTPPIPHLWLPASQAARVFLPYYCSYLDSETTKRKQYQPARIEAYLLKTILSMENVVLTVNQAVDNAIIRSLAYQPGFRQMLRTGHVTVSFFRNYFSLRQYAADQLVNPNFRWSSLPVDFTLDMTARRQAAQYMTDKCPADELPSAYRTLIIRFNEELLLLDENLPACYKARFYQQAVSGRGSPSLADYLDTFFLLRQGNPMLADMCRLHFLLLSPRAPDAARAGLNRSMYQVCLDALRSGSLAFPHNMVQLCNPEIFRPGSEPRRYLESFADPQKQNTLDLMQSILSDCHNRMLGCLCTDYQHHLYSESERLILPYDETDPINNGGCRLFQDTVTTTETGIHFGWDQAPEFLERSESILRQEPTISPDRLADKLAGNELDYTISGDGGALWLARGTLHTSQHQSLLVELRHHTGTIHLQTEGV